MPAHKVNHQIDLIIVPRQDVILDQCGNQHRVYIKVKSLEALNKIIEQCMIIKEDMEGKFND